RLSSRVSARPFPSTSWSPWSRLEFPMAPFLLSTSGTRATRISTTASENHVRRCCASAHRPKRGRFFGG
ncbi:hypothetical protein PMAYCL1PPCAC_08729, partial [Pristionchus mayeri]